MSALLKRVRAAFLAGLLVGVPLGVTVWVMVTLIGFLEAAVHLLPDRLQPEHVVGHPIPGLGIVLALGTIVVLGVVTRSYVGSRVVFLSERLLARVPVVSSIYIGLKQLMETVFVSGKGSFRTVVLIEYPRRGVYSLAFKTHDGFVRDRSGNLLVSVFLPTTPNPTSGYYLMVRPDDVTPLPITVEEAFKLIMSAGIVHPDREWVLQEHGVEDQPARG